MLKNLCQCIPLTAALLLTPPSQAEIITYSIEVTVTAAPTAPGTFASNPWHFDELPALFSGTFEADDTAVGQVSNFQLVIGDIDIAALHVAVNTNIFDPRTRLLEFFAFQADLESFVSFGGFRDAPDDYAVAMQNTSFSPTDPYVFDATQNWVGSLRIGVAPAPSTYLLLALGLTGFATRRRARRRLRDKLIANRLRKLRTEPPPTEKTQLPHSASTFSP